MHQEPSVATDNTVSTPEPKASGAAFYLLLGLIFAGFWFAYFIQPAEGAGTGKGEKSVMRWLVGHWDAVSNYSHGPLIPLIAAGLIARRSKRLMHLWDNNQRFRTAVYALGFVIAVGIAWSSLPKPFTDQIDRFLQVLRWDEYDLEAYTLFIPLLGSLAFYLAEQKAEPNKWGLALVGFALLIYWIAIKSAQQHAVVISFVIMLFGLPLYLWGKEACKPLIFPVAFLFLMVPLNFLDRITVPLANFVTVCAAFICNTVGVEVAYKGTSIWSAKGAFQFEIAEACSGIRSLVALGMVTAIYAYLTEKSQWKRWAIFCASLPLAVLGNMARVTTIMLVAQAFGQEAAGGLYHDYSSFIFFPVALLGMVVFAAMLNLDYHAIWQRLMTPSVDKSKPRHASTTSESLL